MGNSDRKREDLINYLLGEVTYSDESTTGLFWKKRKRGRVISKPSGYQDKDGYYVLVVERRRVLNHHLIYRMFNGEIPEGLVIDHIDGDIKNNCPSNLRAVERKLNSRNTNLHIVNKSGVMGVNFEHAHQRWVATWCCFKTGKKQSKKFSLLRYGEAAFFLACEYRAKMIAEMNSQGAGYTERHGEEGVNHDVTS